MSRWLISLLPIGLQQHIESYQKNGAQLSSSRGAAEMSPGASSNPEMAGEIKQLKSENKRLQEYVLQYEDQIKKLESDLSDLKM